MGETIAGSSSRRLFSVFAFCWRTSAVRAFSTFGMKVRSVMFPVSPTESPYAVLVASIFRSMYCASVSYTHLTLPTNSNV